MGAYVTVNVTAEGGITGSGTANQMAMFASSQSVGNPIISFTGHSVGFTVGSTTVYASSAFSIDSTTTGFLPPRMTTAQRNSIATPVAGLMIFNTTLDTYSIYTSGGGAPAWSNVITTKQVPATYAVGDILYASTTSTLATLADVATGNALISGGINTAPSWGTIGLTTHVSGILGPANGGSGIANNAASTLTITGNFATTITLDANSTIGLGNWTDFSGTTGGTINPQGFSAFSINQCRYIKIGKTVFMYVYITGTSNATTLTFTLPFTAANNSETQIHILAIQDLGVGNVSNGYTTSNSTTYNVNKGIFTSSFTASGTKTVSGLIVYHTT